MQTLTGTIISWDRQKGYGYLEAGGTRVFLHCRDFAERRKAPEVGDRITFVPGTDSKGRSCATRAVHHNDGGSIRLAHLAVLIVLLIVPAIAMARIARQSDFQIVFGWYVVASAFTYFVYADDKRRARRGEWRAPESYLHLFELAGGWPGAFLAQRRLRHKSSKLSFQVRFWLIVAAHQFAAVDYLQDWRLTRATIHAMRSANRATDSK